MGISRTPGPGYRYWWDERERPGGWSQGRKEFSDTRMKNLPQIMGGTGLSGLPDLSLGYQWGKEGGSKQGYTSF